MSKQQELFSKLGVPKVANSRLDNLLTPPKEEKDSEEAHFNVPTVNDTHQADILYLPDDDGYKYLLVVVDLGNRACDARKLKTHSSAETANAIMDIYKKGKYLRKPRCIEVDDGNEFKGQFAGWCLSNRIDLIHKMPTRSQGLAVVERYNQIIGNVLNRIMFSQEILYEDTIRWWTDRLPEVIDAVNEFYKTAPASITSNDGIRVPKDGAIVYPVGTIVRRRLYKPIGHIDGERLSGNFRGGDLRWDPQLRRIERVILMPGQPPMYRISGYEDGPSFTKGQLQVIPSEESLPDQDIITRHIPESIVDKVKIRGRVHYIVKFRGYTLDRNRDIVSAAELTRTNPDMVREYNQSLNV